MTQLDSSSPATSSITSCAPEQTSLTSWSNSALTPPLSSSENCRVSSLMNSRPLSLSHEIPMPEPEPGCSFSPLKTITTQPRKALHLPRHY
ncbi:hypothetical protein E2C01_056137 [Portunus trituberculatus]|uniref:Uncharacterized protein n=1 Tax=Portunus trituberculatus TaxID=210409 RepID=A0A5B7GY46_PORTR|nr:hypothetical protein [Portunus trituberculatus]